MGSDCRHDMKPPFVLKNPTESEENLLMTKGEGEGYSGIELRRSSLDVVALGRSDTRSAMPVTGWDTRFSDVDTLLYLLLRFVGKPSLGGGAYEPGNEDVEEDAGDDNDDSDNTYHDSVIEQPVLDRVLG